VILVTGGAGYIGSHTLLALSEAGQEPLVVDNLSQGKAEYLLGAKLVQLDLRDREGLAKVIKGHNLEGIIHFAALSEVGRSMRDPKAFYENNVIGGLNLFGLAAEAGLPVVLSSSCAVYGLPQSLPLREDHPRDPISPYGFTKLVLEQALEDFERAYGLRWISLRYFNAAGADPEARLGEDHEPETHLIPIVLEAAGGKRDEVTVFGCTYPTRDGTCIRDYIHVCDLASAHVCALSHMASGRGGLALNLGTGQGLSVMEIIDLSRRVTGRPIPAREVAPRPGDPPELVADASLAGEILDWRPHFTDPAEIVATAWEWYKRKEGL